MVDTTAHPASEVLEEFAEGDLKGIYSDIRATFRVPLVNLIFRVLATQPDYLRLAWRQLHTNAQTVYFEQQADELRAYAVDAAARLGGSPGAAPPGAVDVLKVFHYVNPKILLAVAALRACTNGQYPRAADVPMDQKRQIASGVPKDMPTIELIDENTDAAEVRPVFDDIQQTLGLRQLNTDYRALAVWPDYLQSAWSGLKPSIASQDYRNAERVLRRMADEAVLSMPFRIEVNGHVLRHCGLSEQAIDDVREILERFYRLLPGLVLNVSFLAVGALGTDAARVTPYPAQVL